MPIFNSIPMPQNGMDAFMTGMQSSQTMFDSMMKNRMTPYQIKLLEAQAQEAQGKGASETMKANLLQRAMNHGQPLNSVPAALLQNAPENEPSVTGNVPIGTMPASGAAIMPGESPSGTPEQNTFPAGRQKSGFNQQPSLSEADKKKIAELQPGESHIIGSADASEYAPTTMPPAAIAQSQNDLNGNKPGVISNPANNDELASEIIGLPVKEETVQGYHYSKNPLTGDTIVTRRGQTPEEKAEMDRATHRSGAFATQDAKLANVYDTQAMAGENTMSTLKNIGETINSPEWKEMRSLASLPGGGKASLWWYAHNGTPEQQKIAGDFVANTGQIVANMAPMFKGQFRKGEQSLINNMKINENDTVNAAQGKYQAIMSMEKFITNRSKLMSKFIREGSSPTEASDKADSMLKGNLVRKYIDEEIGSTKASAVEHARLEKLAKDAIAKGAKPEEVNAMLEKLKSGE